MAIESVNKISYNNPVWKLNIVETAHPIRITGGRKNTIYNTPRISFIGKTELYTIQGVHGDGCGCSPLFFSRAELVIRHYCTRKSGNFCWNQWSKVRQFVLENRHLLLHEIIRLPSTLMKNFQTHDKLCIKNLGFIAHH